MSQVSHRVVFPLELRLFLNCGHYDQNTLFFWLNQGCALNLLDVRIFPFVAQRLISLIYTLLVFDFLDLYHTVINELNSTCEGQGNTNMVLQNATF